MVVLGSDMLKQFGFESCVQGRSNSDSWHNACMYVPEPAACLVLASLFILMPAWCSSCVSCILCLLSLTVPSCVFSPLPLCFSEPDVFALGEVVTSTYAQNVLYCVASNFLEVKQLASSLIQQLPPSAVGLEVLTLV